MSDREFWLCMATMIEAAETMPDFRPYLGACVGLCELTDVAVSHGIISRQQQYRLSRQIRNWMRENQGSDIGYAFIPCEWRPRVKMCRELAEMSDSKEKP